MPRPSGFAAFFVLWCGQFLSVVGTRMTNFAISIWVWDATGNTTEFALTMFFAFAGTVIFSPVAGSFIDRWNRRLTLLLSDLGAGIATIVMLVLFFTDSTQMWHLYAINFVTGSFVAFQVPVFQATITTMLERANYTRGNAMLFAVRSTPELFAPLVAAVLLAVTSIETVLLIDIASFLFAVGTVLLVALPATPKAPEGTEPVRFWQDCLTGFRYILRNRSLLNLELFLIAINILASVGFLLLRPMALARTGDSAGSLALVLSTGAIGGVAGALLIGVLKSPKDKMIRVLWATVAFSLVGRVLYGVADMVIFLGVALIVVHLCIPIIDGYTNTVWQEKVEPHMQGRVFAARQFVEEMSIPIATVIAGPLIDAAVTPWMQPGNGGASTFGWLVGTGQAGAIGLMFVVIGVLGTVVAVMAFLSPSIRNVETLLPDQVPAEDEKESIVEPELAAVKS
jgi:MFS transporter, DHA3 family, macrolide efflux protein